MKRKYINRVLILGVLTCLLSCQPKRGDYDVAAYVWPAYHNDPRYAELGLFEQGMGEWEVVTGAHARTDGHRQPRIPLWGTLDEASPVTQEKIIRTAVEHGVNTFIFDWYWYDGRPFLEDVLNKGFLQARHNRRMNFFLMWANHTANAYWDPREVDKGKVYWHGETSRADFDAFTEHIIEDYFKRPNYYTIDGKPVFAIYEIGTFIRGMGGMAEAREALEAFRARCTEAGLPGVHLMAIVWAALPSTLSDTPGDDTPTQDKTLTALGFDSMTNYQWCHLVGTDCDYADWGREAIRFWEGYDRDFTVPYFPHVSIDWDPNPRYPDASGLQPFVRNTNPEQFEAFLREAKAYVDAHPSQPPLITINAWNEWAEGSCLEPDTTYTYSYLEAVRRVFKR